MLEGIAQRCVDVIEALDVNQALNVDGGLARSECLLQMLADLSGREVLRAVEVETTALGAAMLAGLAVALHSDPAPRIARKEAPARFIPQNSADWRQGARHEWKRALERTRG